MGRRFHPQDQVDSAAICELFRSVEVRFRPRLRLYSGVTRMQGWVSATRPLACSLLVGVFLGTAPAPAPAQTPVGPSADLAQLSESDPEVAAVLRQAQA